MKLSATGKTKTSIYLPVELFWRMKAKAVELRMSDTEFMEQAVRSWVETEEDNPARARSQAASDAVEPLKSANQKAN